MSELIPSQAAQLLLLSIYKTRGEDGLICKFLFGPPGAPSWNQRLGTEIFFRRQPLVRAALFVRQSGPVYLKSMSVADIQSLLRSFVTANYGYLADETFLQRFDVSFNEHLSDKTKATFANALASSDIFNPSEELTLYPLVPVRIEDDFSSPPFFLIGPASLLEQAGVPRSWLPEQFPPFRDWKGRRETSSAWLGVRSPIIQASNKMKAAILGALALTPHPRYRHQFSMRAMFGGRLTIATDGQTVMSFGEQHTPGMSEDIVIRQADHAWLCVLAPKLLATESTDQRQVRALEYFYRAWSLDASERFPWLFMALDAIFGDSSRATNAVIEAIRRHDEGAFEPERLKMLLKLRASVIHGGAPDVYDSEKYHRYYERYGDDPIFDLELITAQSLRSTIFGNTLAEHAEPHAELIRAYKAGNFPPKRQN
jgi:hypothetical protein